MRYPEAVWDELVSWTVLTVMLLVIAMLGMLFVVHYEWGYI